MKNFGKCQDPQCGHYEYQHAPDKLCIGINENNVGCWCRKFTESTNTVTSNYSLD